MNKELIYPEVSLTPEWKEGRRFENVSWVKNIDKLSNLCFTREGQLAAKIKGHDYHNGYSCALHDIRMELKALRHNLKLGDAPVSGGDE